MNTAIFSVKKPAIPSGTKWNGWLEFESALNNILKRSEDVEQIAENCWQISLDTATSVLAGLVNMAHEKNLDHKAIYLQEKPVVYSRQFEL